MGEIERPVCQNLVCGAPIAVLPGHRRRQYCDDVCRQAACQARKRQQAQAEEEARQQAEELRALELLRELYGDLLPETLQLLKTLQNCYGHGLRDAIGRILMREHEAACQGHEQQWNALVEKVMFLAEETWFGPQQIDDVYVAGGSGHWCAFVGSADMMHLGQAYNMLSVQMSARERHKRLPELPKQL